MALADALKERPGVGQDDEERARLAYSLLAGAHLVFGIESTLAGEPDWPTLLTLRDQAFGREMERLEVLIRERWEDAEGDEAARQQAVEALREWIAAKFSPDERAQDAWPLVDALWLAKTLAGFDIDAYVSELTDLLEASRTDDDYDADVYDLLEDIWMKHPSSLREHAAEWIGFGSALGSEVAVTLGELNVRWASALLLDRFDELLAQPGGEELWEILQRLGDPAALERVVDQWKPGETRVARCAVFLARLAGRLDELSQELVDEAERSRQRAEQGMQLFERVLQSGEMPWEALETGELVLDLRCTQCGHTHSYAVGQAFIDPASVTEDGSGPWSDDVVLDRIITCKSCGAVDQYELTAMASMGLIARMMRSRSSDEPMAAQVVFARPALHDGTLVRRPSEAIAHLEEYARRHPGDAEAWRRLGNVCKRYHEFDQAEHAWRKAVEVDDNEAEAAYSLVEHLWDPHEPNLEAFDFTLMALERLPKAAIEPAARRAIAFDLLDALQAYVPVVHPPLALRAAWGAGQVGGSATVNMSEIDLRRIRDWDRLAELFANEVFAVVQFTSELPEDTPTMLERLINQPDPMPSSLSRSARAGHASGTYVKPADEEVGRNDPCPCGSGRKYKKCCLRKR